MTSPFSELEVDEALRPSAAAAGFDLDRALSSVVTLEARVPDDAFTAATLGTERAGAGVVVREDGLVVTIGYLITEAESVTLTTGDGRRVSAHVLGIDPVTGFGLVHALDPLGLPALPLGDSRRLSRNDPVILAGGGGAAHALVGRIRVREAFAGYWEYLLEEALFTGPAHPHWSGAALIGPSGELVGLGSLQVEHETAGGEAIALNMCVPAELLAPILDDLSRGRPAHPSRPWLGVFCQEVDSSVVVLALAAGGPASRAELRRGDIILAVDEHPVVDLADFYTRLWSLGAAGATVPLTLSRGGDVFDVEIRSVDRASMLKKPRFN
ncbi:MAG TPA: S1C family serine protease [Caulobacteraceae bacterium]|nr:S1C family serine protease [Caulobacteraceae bacterium]